MTRHVDPVTLIEFPVASEQAMQASLQAYVALGERLRVEARNRDYVRGDGQVSLPRLSFLLRHRELWPSQFRWNYGNFDNCAVSLARSYWFIPAVGVIPSRNLYHYFGLDRASYQNIFIGGGDWVPLKSRLMTFLTWAFPTMSWKSARKDLSQVTPEMVADQIDLYLASPKSAMVLA